MNNLRRILDLAKRTGDRVIITDPDGEDAFVVMGLDQYEGLLDGKAKTAPVQPKTTVLPAKRSLVDEGPRLRQDRDRRPVETPELDDSAPPDLFDLMKPAGDSGDTWDLGKMSEAEREEVLRQFTAYQEETASAPKSPPKAAQNDDLNEDQFYLEPIE